LSERGYCLLGEWQSPQYLSASFLFFIFLKGACCVSLGNFTVVSSGALQRKMRIARHATMKIVLAYALRLFFTASMGACVRNPAEGVSEHFFPSNFSENDMEIPFYGKAK
jgi:hypothetical protein